MKKSVTTLKYHHEAYVFICHFNWNLSVYTREGNGNTLQYSCLENSMDKGAWWTTVHGVTKSQMQLNDWAGTSVCTNTNLRVSGSPSSTWKVKGHSKRGEKSFLFKEKKPFFFFLFGILFAHLSYFYCLLALWILVAYLYSWCASKEMPTETL